MRNLPPNLVPVWGFKKKKKKTPNLGRCRFLLCSPSVSVCMCIIMQSCKHALTTSYSFPTHHALPALYDSRLLLHLYIHNAFTSYIRTYFYVDTYMKKVNKSRTYIHTCRAESIKDLALILYFFIFFNLGDYYSPARSVLSGTGLVSRSKVDNSHGKLSEGGRE